MGGTMINNLEAYKVFYYVAKCGSVTKAAGELSISQPAVSQAVKQLENTLDVSLFHRAAKGVRLTGEGELLYSYVAKGYEQIELGVKKVHQMQNMELGEVRIGASDMTLQFYLLPYLEKFHEKYPGIKVIVSNAPTPETLNSLREGRIDFGIVSTPFPDRPDIQMIPVREIEDVFVAGRRFFGYKNKMLDFQELESLPLIFLEKNTSSRSYMDEFLAGNGVYVQPEFELATSDMIVQFVRRNLGVGCVMRDFARDYVESGLLFELRFNKMIPKRQFCVVRNTKMPMAPAAEKLLEVIQVYGQAHDFTAVVPISAKSGEGVEELLGVLEGFLTEGPQLFPEDMVTDQPERQIMAEILREKLLLCLDKEIPHGTAVEITKFSERDSGVIDVDATIYCEKASHKGIIIGKGGAMLKKISTLARTDIEAFMGTKVFLQTWVKVKENWRDNMNLIKNFGYRDE